MKNLLSKTTSCWSWRRYSIQVYTGTLRDENINVKSDRTSSMSEKMQTKQSLQSSEFSSNHQIPTY